MDPQTKKTLKESREALDRKEYQKAVKLSKLVLKKNEGIYMAYVIQGKALLEQSKYQQSLESYKKAVALDNDKILAWQGIVEVYERQGIKCHSDLLDAYKKVATHYENDQDNHEAYIESTMKMVKSLASEQETSRALKILIRLKNKTHFTLEIANMMLELFRPTRYEERSTEENQVYAEALEFRASIPAHSDEETFRKLLYQLYRAGKYTKIAEMAYKVKEKWNRFYSPMEWICRLYLENLLIVPKNCVPVPIYTITERLFKVNPSSRFGCFARGKYLYSVGELHGALQWLKTGLESSFNIYAAECYVNVNLVYQDYHTAFNICMDVPKKVDSKMLTEDYLVVFEMYAFHALIYLDTEKASNQLLKIEEKLKDTPEDYHLHQALTLLKARFFVEIIDFSSLKKIMDMVKKSRKSPDDFFLYQVCEILCGCDVDNPKETVQNLVLTLNFEEASISRILLVAQTLFNLKLYPDAAELFLKCTKKDSGKNHPVPWRYLGLLYEMQGNVPNALKCIKKSYDLHSSTEVALLLSDLYYKFDDIAGHIEHLTTVTKVFSKCDTNWAWVRLGLLYMEMGDATEAVTSLQSAIRANKQDCNVWESLGDAYYSRGSYTSALKAFKQALLLGADPYYPKLRIGAVHQALKEYDEALTVLLELHEEIPSFEPLLLQVCKCYLEVLTQRIGNFLHCSAVEAAEKALLFAVRSILCASSPKVLPWEVIGDICLTLSELNSDTTLYVPVYLLENSKTEKENNAKDISLEEISCKKISLKNLLEMGTGVIFRAIQVVEMESSGTLSTSDRNKLKCLLHEKLARCYLFLSRKMEKTSESSKDRNDILHESMHSAKLSVQLNPSCTFSWNTLGVIASELEMNPLAQHCFIKSLSINSKCAISWSNIGALYLKLGEHILAHQCFSRGQAAEPNYGGNWTGQAMVAETLRPEEMIDLFRHACQLDPSVFSILAYAELVCEALLKLKTKHNAAWYTYHIVDVDAVNVATDLLSRIVKRIRIPELYNFKGILSGWNGLLHTACECFDEALSLAKDSGLYPEMTHNIKVNKISVLAHMKEYVQVLKEVETADYHGHNVMLFAGLSFEKLGDSSRADALFKSVLEDTKDPWVKSEAAVLSALLACRSGDLESAKPYLVDESLKSNPFGLMAVCSVALILGDINFVTSVLNQLKNFENDWNFMAGIALMNTYKELMQNNWLASLKHIFRLLHRYPLHEGLWIVAAHSIISHDEDHKYSSSIVRKMLECGRNVVGKTMPFLSPSTFNASQYCLTEVQALMIYSFQKSSDILALTFLLEGNWKKGKKTAIQTIRLYPNERDNWALLACALWFQFCEEKEQSLYQLLLSIIQKEIMISICSERVLKWMELFLDRILSCEI